MLIVVMSISCHVRFLACLVLSCGPVVVGGGGGKYSISGIVLLPLYSFFVATPGLPSERKLPWLLSVTKVPAW